VRGIIDNDYMTMLSRLVIAGMMIYASYYKIVDPDSFARSIYFYHLVPGELINLMAIILPWLELLCGVALLLGVWYRGAVLWSNLLLIVFIIALASTIVRGLDIDCGCFKAGQSATGPAWSSLLFDVVAMLFSVQLWFSRSQRWMLTPR
jgi:putative oxidoreductase